MPENLCPICQRPNDANAERCWYCQAVLSHENEAENNGNTDWLNSFREDSAQSVEPFPVESTPEESEEKQEEIPDWLARIRTREQLEREASKDEKPKAEPEEPKEDLPDWLKEIKAGNSGKQSETVFQEESQTTSENTVSEEVFEKTELPSSTQKEQDDTEEWLSHLAAWRPVDNLPSASDSLNPFLDEKNSNQPDNLSDQSVHLTSLTGSDDTNKQPVELKSSEGWQIIPEESVTEPESSNQDGPAEPDQTNSSVEIEKPHEVMPPGPDEIAFDVDSLREEFGSQESFSTIENQEPEPGTSPFKEETQPPDSGTDNSLLEPAALTDSFSTTSESTPAFLENLPGAEPFLQDDLPEWLASATINKIDQKPAEEISQELDSKILDANIDEANLPDWLQAIRPISEKGLPEAESEPETSQIIEEVGLLAGISGTLQSSQVSGEFRKPVGYGSALKVSERQKSNANLLASLVKDNLDDEDVEIPKNQKIKHTLFRLALAAALILIILFGNSIMSGLTVVPKLFPPEVVAVYDKVNALPTDKPVLLTGDFEPAVTGELSWSSQTLIEHMMRRNLNFAVLSVNPGGDVILLQQLETISQKVPGYDLSTHVIDLGYLPGGSTGLQLLTKDIRSAVPNKYDVYDVHAAWNSPILQSVHSLNDFGAVIINSDKPESARVWVEQIQPAMDATPLLFVISAQAAPLLEPYYQSGQISGYIGGFSGSLAYEAIFQQSSNSTNHLGAFQASLLFIAALVFMGGLINLIRPSAIEHKGHH